MIKIELIEEALRQQGGTEFQRFCDHYLRYKYPNQEVFGHTGSQLGVRNPVKGAPDGFFVLDDGRIFYQESTGQQKDLKKKIKKDISNALLKAADFSFTGTLTIILNLKIKTDLELYHFAKSIADSHKVLLEFNTIDSIAADIFHKYQPLGKVLLDIPLDTEQILSFRDFIKTYEHHGRKMNISLSNIFIPRPELMELLLKNIETQDLLILEGPPGVGKTRAAIEGIKAFINKHSEYRAYAIHNKDRDLFDDLSLKVKKNKKYLLFIDDANRQLVNFRQVLAKYLSNSATIKIILSIRHYALRELDSVLMDYKFQSIKVPRFKEQELLALLESESFKVTDHKITQQILQMAKGNPRLAIMAAEVVNIEGPSSLTDSVLNLYDTYFENILKDTSIFHEPQLLKVLGIMGFFYTIDLDDKAFLAKLLEHFELNSNEFHQAVGTLNNLEFLQINEHYVQVSEQLLSEYFFVKVFIRDRSLSFARLWNHYYQKYYYRMRDVLHTPLRTLKKEEIWDPIAPIIEHILAKEGKEVTRLEIFEICWFYIPEKVLVHFDRKIQTILEPQNPSYIGDYQKIYTVPENRELKLLTKFLKTENDNFLLALELCYRYTSKDPKYLPRLNKLVGDILINYKVKDDRIDRQLIFFTFLLEHEEIASIHHSIFIMIREYFFFHWMPEQLTSKHLVLNQLIWEWLLKKAADCQLEVHYLLLKYDPEWRVQHPQLFKQELKFINTLLSNHYDPSKVIDTYIWVHLTREIENYTVLPQEWEILKERFDSNLCQEVRLLLWDSILNYVDSHHQKGSRDYQNLKEVYLHHHFHFKSFDEFKSFYTRFLPLFTFETQEFQLQDTLDLIMAATYRDNAALGLQAFQFFLQGEQGHLLMRYTIKIIVQTSASDAQLLWDYLNKMNVENSMYSKNTFFKFIPDAWMKTRYAQDYLNSVRQFKGSLYLDFRELQKSIPHKASLFAELLEVILNKNRQDIPFILAESAFLSYWKYFNEDYNLIRELYFGQVSVSKRIDQYDPEKEVFQKVLAHYPDFLVDFGERFYSQDLLNIRSVHNQMQWLWDSSKYYLDIEKLVDILQYPFSIARNEYLRYLFRYETSTQKKQLYLFLDEFLEKHSNNAIILDLIFKGARSLDERKYKQLLQKYLRLNPDVQVFRQIRWTERSGMVLSGNVITEELDRQDWQRILGYIEDLPPLPLLAIKEYIKTQISYAIQGARKERLRLLLSGHY